MYIAIINYNMGNIKSVENALKKLGASVKVTGNPKDIDNAKAIILPGVGAFRDAYNNMEKLGLIEAIRKNIEKKLFLGICLGMQILFDYSMEDGKSKGFGILKGFVDRVPPGVKVPHMGWNQLKICRKESELFSGIKEGENFYFVHSYHIIPEDRAIISSTTDYGVEIVSSIEKENIYGLQFHPEKSSTFGQVLLKNFLKIGESKNQ